VAHVHEGGRALLAAPCADVIEQEHWRESRHAAAHQAAARAIDGGMAAHQRRENGPESVGGGPGVERGRVSRVPRMRSGAGACYACNSSARLRHSPPATAAKMAAWRSFACRSAAWPSRLT